MKEKMKYQPEDIEALLAEKSFRELYDEEKKFVLEHLASPGEYERMRETLLSIRGGVGGDRDELHPGEHVRERLMKEFEEKKRRGAIIWWNGLLIGMRDTLRFDLPVVRYSFAILVIALGSVLWFMRNGNEDHGKNEFAMHDKVAPVIQLPQQQVISPVDSLTKNRDQPVKEVVKDGSQPKHPLIVSPKQNDKQPQVAPKDDNAIAVNHSSSDSAKLLAVNSGNQLDARVPDSLASTVVFDNNSSLTPNNFTWQPADGVSTTVNATSANVATTTTYTVTVTDAAVCNGSSTGITTVTGGTSGYTYAWSNNNGTVVYPQSRALSSDVNAIKLFFELK